MKQEVRPIEPFKRIKFKDVGRLVLSQGTDGSLKIEADEVMLPEIISEVQDETLIIGIREDWITRVGKMFSSFFSSTDDKVTYYVSFVELESISISGKCTMECDQLSTEKFKLSVSGLGRMDIQALHCDTLEVGISGRGEFSASGRADHQVIRISGSGDYKAPELVSQNTRVVISGQGNAEINVQESLDITISGLGQVNYRGRPKLRQVISGLGKSKKVD
jgi:hypothetical protein